MRRQSSRGSVADLCSSAFPWSAAIKDHDLLPYGVWVSFFALVGECHTLSGSLWQRTARKPDLRTDPLPSPASLPTGQTFYREGAPVQPEPKEMSATLVTLASYVRPDMYDGFPWAKVSSHPLILVDGSVG